MQFFFIRQEESSVHYHQDLEIIYVMKGKMEIKIDESVYQLQKGDFILINANKRHSCVGTQGILAARFFIDFHILAEHMGTLQLMFWCNTVVDRNDAYEEVRKLLDRILSCCSDQEEKGALYLNSLYYELLYHLVSYFMVKADQVWTNQEDSRNQIRVRQMNCCIQIKVLHVLRWITDFQHQRHLSRASGAFTVRRPASTVRGCNRICLQFTRSMGWKKKVWIWYTNI